MNCPFLGVILKNASAFLVGIMASITVSFTASIELEVKMVSIIGVMVGTALLGRMVKVPTIMRERLLD